MKLAVSLMLISATVAGAFVIPAVRNLLGLASPSGVISYLVSDGGVEIVRGIAYGKHPRQRVDVYHPRGAAAGPVILFVYGGAWTSGSRDYYRFVGSALAARGFTTVVADYRIFPEVRFPAFVEDVAQAYAWVHANLRLDGGARDIVLMGHSAGAHTAALIGYDSHYLEAIDPALPRPAAVVGLAGPYAFDPTTWPSTREIFATAPSADDARPLSQVKPGAPPTFIAHGRADTTVEMYNLDNLEATLKAADVSVTARRYKGVAHIELLLAFAWPLRGRATVLDDVTGFIHRTVGAQGAVRG